MEEAKNISLRLTKTTKDFFEQAKQKEGMTQEGFMKYLLGLYVKHSEVRSFEEALKEEVIE